MLDTQQELADWFNEQLPAKINEADCRLSYAKGKLHNGEDSYGVAIKNITTGTVYAVSPISNQLHMTMTDLSSHFAVNPKN